MQESRDLSLHLLAPRFRIATWPLEYHSDPAIDIVGNGDRIPGGRQLLEHWVNATTKASAWDLPGSLF